MATNRFAKSAAYQSTTTPIPITSYKPTTPPAVAGFFTAIREAAAAIMRKAKLIAAIALEKLNVSGIRAFLAKVMAVRNAVMNAVSKAVAWVSAVVTGIKNLVSDIVSGIKSLVDDLNALIKANPFYQLANALCGGIDLTGISNQIKGIQTRLDTDSILDYILENHDKDLLKNIKNCQIFNKESKAKLKSAVDGLFDSSNVMMLAAMADKIDYWDVKDVDRKFRKAATYMEDSTLSKEAIDEIRGYMFLSEKYAVLLNDNRFQSTEIYDGPVVKEMRKTVPNYLKSITGNDGDLIAKAMVNV